MIAPIYTTVGRTVALKGNAYDFGHSISAIQFSLDDGQNWTTYDTPGTNDYKNLTWSFEWAPPQPGDYTLLVRSVNDRGETSPESAYVHIHVGEGD